MDVQYNNLYTHFVFTTQDRFPAIAEIHRERIEKYITGMQVYFKSTETS